MSQLQVATSEALKTNATRDGTSQLWRLFVIAWLGLVGIGLLLLKVGVPWEFSILVIAPITLAGVAWKPVFGVCLMALLMPFGAVFNIQGVFTIERGMGILFALGAVAHLLATRKRLRPGNPVVLALFGMTALGFLSILWSRYPPVTTYFAITLAQFFAYAVLVTAVIRRERDLEWPLRVMVIACVGSYLFATLTGIGGGATARFAIQLGEGQALNPNAQGAIFGLAFISTLYLYRRETIPGLKWVWVISALLLPVGILATGGRKASFLLIVPLMLPLLSPRFTLRRPGRTAAIILGIGALAAVVLYALVYVLPENVATRYQDPESAVAGFRSRLSFIQEGIDYVARHPLGAGLGTFRTGAGKIIHNDFFYLFVDIGFPGGLVFGAFAAAILVGLIRMQSGTSRWFAASIILYLLLFGLGGTLIYGKHYWLFMAFASLVATFNRKPSLKTQPEGDLVHATNLWEPASKRASAKTQAQRSATDGLDGLSM